MQVSALSDGAYVSVNGAFNVNRYHSSGTVDNGLGGIDSYALKMEKTTVSPEVAFGYQFVEGSWIFVPEFFASFKGGSKKTLLALANNEPDTIRTTATKNFGYGIGVKIGRKTSDDSFYYGLLGVQLDRFKTAHQLTDGANEAVSVTSKLNRPAFKIGVGSDIFVSDSLFFGGEAFYLIRSQKSRSASLELPLAGDVDSNRFKTNHAWGVKFKIGWKF